MEKTKLVLPAALAVVVLSACGSSHAPEDASTDDAAIADAGTPDAGCQPFEEWDPVTMECVPLV